MARRIRVKALADISSRRELREAMAEVQLRTWYAERRLGENARGLFSLENRLPTGGIVRGVLRRLFHRA